MLWQVKMHVIDALERALFPQLPSSRATMLSIGSNVGFLEGYLSARSRALVKAYDVSFSYDCAFIARSPLLVHYFDGASIPEHDRSYDAVLLLSVLHHAAGRTPALLESASRVARTAIFVFEDLETGSTDRSKMNLMHDSEGHFRTDAQWRKLFGRYCTGFRLARSGFVRLREFEYGREGLQVLWTGLGESVSDYQAYYLLSREV